MGSYKTFKLGTRVKINPNTNKTFVAEHLKSVCHYIIDETRRKAYMKCN